MIAHQLRQIKMSKCLASIVPLNINKYKKCILTNQKQADMATTNYAMIK